MKIGSLFSGYGGLDIGVQSVLGGSTAWVCEIEPAPSKILAHHLPDAPNLGDITAVDWSEVEPVDVLTGGFPCQDVSHAGKRAGLKDGTRSGLWSYMHDAIDHLRPQLVVIENVRGLLSASTGRSSKVVTVGPRGGRKVGVTDRALGVVLADLADIGYDAAWYGLRAADVGAAHGRFRVFIFAWPAADAGRGEHGWPVLVRAEHARPDTADLTLLPTPAVNDMGEGKTVEAWDEWTARMKSTHGNGNGHGKSLAIEAQRLLPTPVSDNSRGLPSSGTAYASLPNAVALLPGAAHHDRWGEYADAIARWEAVLGRPAPVPTEIGAARLNRHGNPSRHPRLSPRFVEWLMGLPAGWVTDPAIGLTRNQQLKALGNGVVPQQAAAATRAWLGDFVSANEVMTQ